MSIDLLSANGHLAVAPVACGNLSMRIQVTDNFRMRAELFCVKTIHHPSEKGLWPVRHWHPKRSNLDIFIAAPVRTW
jgi:hypothetical protein